MENGTIVVPEADQAEGPVKGIVQWYEAGKKVRQDFRWISVRYADGTILPPTEFDGEIWVGDDRDRNLSLFSPFTGGRPAKQKPDESRWVVVNVWSPLQLLVGAVMGVVGLRILALLITLASRNG